MSGTLLILSSLLPISTLRAGDHIVLDTQLDDESLMAAFNKDIAQRPDLHLIRNKINEIAIAHPNLDTQTRIFIQVGEDGHIKILGMDWLGFIEDVFFISPPIFVQSASQSQRAFFPRKGVRTLSKIAAKQKS